MLKLNNFSILFLLLTLFYFKVASYVVLKVVGAKLFGGASGSDCYHAYAIGEATHAVNYWPVVLRFLNDFGLYSRDYISYFVFLLNLIVISVLVHSVSVVSRSASHQRNFLVSLLVMTTYPTLFFFSLDMYRDLVIPPYSWGSTKNQDGEWFSLVESNCSWQNTTQEDHSPWVKDYPPGRPPYLSA